MNIRLYYPNSIAENTTGLNFFNKNGEWKSEIIFLQKNRVEVKFLKKIKQPTSSSKINLAICLVKKNPMDNILQKATELGVGKIIPIISERTEVKELNFERAKKIVIEATEQSNQLIPPEILGVVKLKDFLLNLNANSKLLFADVKSHDNLKKEDINNGKRLSVLIGPEGDFSPYERQIILGNTKVKPFRITRNILRSDTAVISAISMINFINNFN